MLKLSYKTDSIRKQDAPGMREWFIVDAEGETVGRICSKIGSASSVLPSRSSTTAILN